MNFHQILGISSPILQQKLQLIQMVCIKISQSTLNIFHLIFVVLVWTLHVSRTEHCSTGLETIVVSETELQMFLFTINNQFNKLRSKNFLLFSVVTGTNQHLKVLPKIIQKDIFWGQVVLMLLGNRKQCLLLYFF